MPPLHRKNLYGLQYSMLPARRVGIKELWEMMNRVRERELRQVRDDYSIDAEGVVKSRGFVNGVRAPNGGF